MVSFLVFFPLQPIQWKCENNLVRFCLPPKLLSGSGHLRTHFLRLFSGGVRTQADERLSELCSPRILGKPQAVASWVRGTNKQRLRFCMKGMSSMSGAVSRKETVTYRIPILYWQSTARLKFQSAMIFVTDHLRWWSVCGEALLATQPR